LVRFNARKVFKLFAIIAIAILLQAGAMVVAYKDRGYMATGGEMLVFPMVCWIGYKAFCYPGESLLEEEE
jgi:hypothetical protein